MIGVRTTLVEQKEQTAPKRTARRVRAFWRDDSGVFMVMGILFFVMMLMVAGIGVDLMHLEAKRARLQSATDRGTLAAMGTSQQVEGSVVMAD